MKTVSTVARGGFQNHRVRNDEGALRIGLLGFGAIARSLVRVLEDPAAHQPAGAAPAQAGFEIVSVLVRAPGPRPEGARFLPGAVFTTDPVEFWRQSPQLVVECAGHSAVRDVCPNVLARGADLIVISVGALADRAVETALREAAQGSAGRLTLPAGAVGGLDLLAAARLAGLDRVQYVSRKPPRAWKGTQAEGVVALDSLADAVEFYRGDAREAALAFPQNANVAAAIALAGIGFERTEVALVADPGASGNEHRWVAEGAFGRAEMRVAGRPLPENPKTSWLAALSLARAVLDAGARVVI